MRCCTSQPENTFPGEGGARLCQTLLSIGTDLECGGHWVTLTRACLVEWWEEA